MTTTAQKVGGLNELLSTQAWFMSLLDKEPNVYTYLDKVLSVDIKACQFTLTELARRKLTNDLDSFWREDIVKFIQLMEITYCIYLFQDGESRLLTNQLKETPSSYKDWDVKYALACLHIKLSMLNFRFDPEEIESNLQLYIQEVRPLLWAAVSKRFNLSCPLPLKHDDTDW